MAKKFVQINGFNKAFSELSSTALNLTVAGIKTSVSDNLGENTIAFITATTDDTPYGFSSGASYIWTKGKLYASTDREIKINGSSVLSANNLSPLDISTLSDYAKLNYANGKLVLDISTATLIDASNGIHGVALAQDVMQVIKDDEEVISRSFAAIKDTAGLTDSFLIDWSNKFSSSTNIVEAIKDLSTDLASSKISVSTEESYVKLSKTNSTIKANVSTATLADASNGKDGLTTAIDVFKVIKENEKVTALLYGALDSKITNSSSIIDEIKIAILDISNRLASIEQNLNI